MDKRILRIESKKVRFGRFSINKDIYYLQPARFGLRIEVTVFTFTNTQEIFVLFGDDFSIKKKELDHYTFENKSKKEIDRKITSIINQLYARFPSLNSVKEKEK